MIRRLGEKKLYLKRHSKVRFRPSLELKESFNVSVRGGRFRERLYRYLEDSQKRI